MRKTLYILTLLAIAGCTFDETQVYNPELRIMFQPAMYMHVAGEDVESFSTEKTFGVCAWNLPPETEWEEGKGMAAPYLNISEAKSQELIITDTTMRDTSKDTLWMVDNKDLWISDNKNLAFMAFAPFGLECNCNIENGVEYSMDFLIEQTDLLYSKPQTYKQRTLQGWLVPIYFEHALCKVEFRVKNRVETDERITIKSIVIDDVMHRGSFRSLLTPQWTTEGEAATLPIFKGRHDTQGLPESIGRSWLVIPQKLETNVTVEYEYTTSANTSIRQKQQTIALRTNLEAGRSYTYTLSVGIDDVKFLEEIVEHRFKKS